MRTLSFSRPWTHSTHSSRKRTQQPITLAPAMAAGCLTAATVINQASDIPQALTLQSLFWLSAALLILSKPPAARPFSLRAAAAVFAAWVTLLIACRDAHDWLNDTLPPACEGLSWPVRVRIADLPTVIDGQGRVLADTLAGQNPACGHLPSRLSIGWTASGHAQQPGIDWAVRPGEHWLLTLTLKRPIATLNFDGFDVHRVWLEQGVGGMARVTAPPRAPLPQRLEMQPATPAANASSGSLQTFPVPDLPILLARWRQLLAQRIATRLPPAEHPYNGILQGLAVGLQKPITPDQWTVLSATGTSHLVSISGMHVTLLAAWLAWVVMRLWPRIPVLGLQLSARRAGALVSLPLAALYAGLAGWGVPAQRTVVSLALGIAFLLMNRKSRPLDLLCLAVCILTLANPWSATSPGFLLSFGAVAVLIFSSAGRARHAPLRYPRLHRFLGEHATVFIGLMPLSVALFGQFSWISPVANAIAISWMGLLTTPLVLTGALLNCPFLLQAAHASLTPLWWVLESLSRFSLAWQPLASPPLAVTLLSLLGGLLALMPAGLMLRVPGLLLAALPFVWPVPTPPADGFELTVLDIGQGNSIAVRTAHHTLLVDAGNATGPRQDQGRLTVMPWLYHRGQRHWDAVLVSHNDSDHAGGMHSVLRSSQTGVLYANPPFEARSAEALKRIDRSLPCVAGQHWQWDGVRFEILYPSESDLHTETEDNARACVLRISSPHGSALLPADIGVEQEAKLLDRYRRDSLRSDIVLVPHHGSETSSSPDFIAAVSARFAVFQVGYRNRYGHPKPAIVNAWQKPSTENLRTDHTGALRFTVDAQGIRLQQARTRLRRFWHLPPQAAVTKTRKSHQDGATPESDALPE